MHTSTSILLVITCRDQPANQHRGKQYVGKFPGTAKLCGHKAGSFFHGLPSGAESERLAE